MSRKQQINRIYIEESVTDAEHEYRKGRNPSRDDDDDDARDDVSSINDVEANTPDDEWTPRRLERRMIEAIKVVEATTRRTGPAGARGYWPETYDLFQDEVGQVQQGTYLLGGNRIRFQATQAQMRRSDEALQWPKRHVQDLRVLKVFNAWLASKAYRLKWARVVKAHGWSLATADRCRDRAKAEIIQGLIAEGVRHQ